MSVNVASATFAVAATRENIWHFARWIERVAAVEGQQDT